MIADGTIAVQTIVIAARSALTHHCHHCISVTIAIAIVIVLIIDPRSSTHRQRYPDPATSPPKKKKTGNQDGQTARSSMSRPQIRLQLR